MPQGSGGTGGPQYLARGTKAWTIHRACPNLNGLIGAGFVLSQHRAAAEMPHWCHPHILAWWSLQQEVADSAYADWL